MLLELLSGSRLPQDGLETSLVLYHVPTPFNSSAAEMSIRNPRRLGIVVRPQSPVAKGVLGILTLDSCAVFSRSPWTRARNY